MVAEEGEIDVDNLILLNQSWVTVPVACDQGNGRRQGVCTEEDGWGNGRIQYGRQQGQMTSKWFK